MRTVLLAIVAIIFATPAFAGLDCSNLDCSNIDASASFTFDRVDQDALEYQSPVGIEPTDFSEDE